MSNSCCTVTVHSPPIAPTSSASITKISEIEKVRFPNQVIIGQGIIVYAPLVVGFRKPWHPRVIEVCGVCLDFKVSRPPSLLHGPQLLETVGQCVCNSSGLSPKVVGLHGVTTYVVEAATCYEQIVTFKISTYTEN